MKPINFGIIKKVCNEYREGNSAVNICTITFLSIPIYTEVNTTTNYNIVESLSTKEKEKRVKHKEIKGFRYETES